MKLTLTVLGFEIARLDLDMERDELPEADPIVNDRWLRWFGHERP